MMKNESLINSPLFNVGASGDYLRIECVKCNERCEFAFLGFDPVIPLATVTCPEHGELWRGKVDGYDDVATSDALKADKELSRRGKISRSLRGRKLRK